MEWWRFCIFLSVLCLCFGREETIQEGKITEQSTETMTSKSEEVVEQDSGLDEAHEKHENKLIHSHHHGHDHHDHKRGDTDSGREDERQEKQGNDEDKQEEMIHSHHHGYDRPHHDHHHDHFHDDELNMVKHGKEKWFKPPSDQHDHDQKHDSGREDERQEKQGNDEEEMIHSHHHGHDHRDHKHGDTDSGREDEHQEKEGNDENKQEEMIHSHHHGHDHHDHKHGDTDSGKEDERQEKQRPGESLQDKQEEIHSHHHGHEQHDHNHNHHDHVHEDEVDMMKRGKEKWFKPASDQDEHKTVESHGHVANSHHDHGHHDHGHHHHHHHETKTIKPKSQKDHRHVHEDDADMVNRGKTKWHKPVSDHHEAEAKHKRESWEIWWESILATVVISAAPYFILHFIPLEKNTKEHEPLLKLLLSFASGGLLGDAFLHLIPHAASPHVHGVEDAHAHHHDHHHHHHEEGSTHAHHHDMSVGVWVLAGIIAFLMVEMFVRHMKSGHGHSHGQSHSQPPSKDEKEADTKMEDKKTKKELPDKDHKEKDKQKRDNEDEEEEETEVASDDPDIKVSGYLNLAADFAHNFTDGLAIGASFLIGRNIGIITTLTVLLHEIPHEIGDFAILVQSGYNKRKAMLLQLSTATGALAGCVCGLLADNLGEKATLWILPFTAGGFIYIATVSVIPELLEEGTSFRQSMKEVCALLVGIMMMVLMCYLE